MLKRPTLVQRPGDWDTILLVDARRPPVPEINGRGRTLVFAHDGEYATVAQFRWASLSRRLYWRLCLASPPLNQPFEHFTVPGPTGRFGRLPRASLSSCRLILLTPGEAQWWHILLATCNFSSLPKEN